MLFEFCSTYTTTFCTLPKNREYPPEFTFQFLFVCVLGFGARVLKPPLALYCDFPTLSLRFSRALSCFVAPLSHFPAPRTHSATATATSISHSNTVTVTVLLQSIVVRLRL